MLPLTLIVLLALCAATAAINKGGNSHNHDSERSDDDDDDEQSRATPSPTPRASNDSTCSGGACPITEPIQVQTLNAEALSVGCKRVCGGDGSLATLEQYDVGSGQCVSQTLFNACDNDAGCAKFRPSPAACYTSTCDPTEHRCLHLQTPGCCTSDSQCPERECFDVTCNCPAAGQALMKRDARSGDLHFHKLATGDCSQQQCVYKARRNCCLRSTSNDTHDTFACNNMNVCSPLETPICDKNWECQCVKQIEIECTTDDDCNPAPANSTTGSTSSTTTSTTTTTTTTTTAPITTTSTSGRKRVVTPRPSSSPSWHDEEDERRTRSDDDDDDEGCGEGGCRERIPFRSNDRCARLKCSKARICVPDEGELDGDGDGVPCREDCDDNNRNVTGFIFCARAGTAALANKFNLDNDSCIDCGAPVDRLCAAACPATVPNVTLALRNGTSVNVTIAYFQVEEEQLCESPQAHGGDFRGFGNSRGGSRGRLDERRDLHVCFGCDCCHNNTGGCDMPSTCGIDRDGDGFPLCGTVQPACVLQPPRNFTRANETTSDDDDDDEHSRSRNSNRRFGGDFFRKRAARFGTRNRWDDDEQSRNDTDFNEDVAELFAEENVTLANGTTFASEADAACVAWGELNNLVDAADLVFIPTVEIGNCENCEGNSSVKELADKTCYLDTDFDGHAQCPFDKTLKACCKTLQGFAKDNTSTITVEPAALDCCNSLNANKTSCSRGTPPILVDQCNCTAPYIPPPGNHVDDCPLNPAGFETYTCFADRDGDGAADCDCPVQICSKVLNDPVEACKKDRSSGFAVIFVDLSHTDKFNNTACDCDDTNCHDRQFVTCLPDADHDGFPACQCTLACGRCDRDQMAFEFGSHPTKRSLAAAAQLLGGHAAHRWGDHERSDDDDDDEQSRRSDGGDDDHCPPPLTHPLPHQACPKNSTAAAILAAGQKKNASFACDCCDADSRTHPGSQVSSGSPVGCPVDNITLFASNDYNCNGKNGLVVACGHKDVERVGNKFYRTIGGPDVFSNINDTDFLGTCTVSMNNCTLKPGFVIEAAGAFMQAQRRKRAKADAVDTNADSNAIGAKNGAHKHADAAPECEHKGVTTIHAPPPAHLTDRFDIGDCGEFVSGCTFINGTCYQDCDVCVLIAH